MDVVDYDYSARQVYTRLVRFVWRYRRMLFAGLVSGMLVGGAWLPIFNMVPFLLGYLQKPEVVDVQAVPQDDVGSALRAEAGDAGSSRLTEPTLQQDDAGTGEKIGAADKWLAQAEKIAGRIGIRIRDDRGVMTWQFLLLAMMILPVLLAVKSMATFCNQYCLRWIGVQVVKDFRDELFAHLQRQSLAFFGRVDVGRLMSRVTHNTSVIDHVVSVNLAELFRIPFEIIIAAGFVVWFAVQRGMLDLLLIAGVGFPLVLVPLIKIGRLIRRWAQKSMQRIATVTSRMHENFTGIRVVKAYHMEEAEIAAFKEVNKRFAKSSLRTIRLSLFMDPIVQTVSFLLVGVFIVICCIKGKTLVDIVPLLMPFMVMSKPIKQLSRIQSSLEQGRVSLSRIYSLLDTHTHLPEAATPVRKETFDDRITFDHVSFSYGDDGEKAVADSTFEIPKGHMVAVVGATGSGKTTLANLLARFYDPTEGRVLLDNVDLRDLAVTDLRRLVGVVTQETILFNTTIRDNIAYGTKGATDEQIIAAARMANAHDFITAHPEGYDRACGEKGFVLSGGERQRIAIARAILKNPPILILDEATSALDTVTERQVQEAITRLMAHRTVFAIAHRLSTVREANLILVVEKGVIIERGTHGELLAQNGRYRALCEMQQGGGLV